MGENRNLLVAGRVPALQLLHRSQAQEYQRGEGGTAGGAVYTVEVPGQGMSFDLTEEQQDDSGHGAGISPGTEVLPTAAERDRTGEFPGEILRKMGELGLMGMNVPPEYNGAGVDTVSYSLALQEIAYCCASTAVIMSVHNSVACGPIFLFGSDYLKETYLKPLAAGKKIGSFAITEPGAGSDIAAQRTKAVRKGDAYYLNGAKIFISTGKNSDVTVVTAYTDRGKKHQGISAFVVEKGTPGFSVGKVEEKMGLRSSDTVELLFEDCRVPERESPRERGRRIHHRHDVPRRRTHRHRVPVRGPGPGMPGRCGGLCAGAGPVQQAHLSVPGDSMDDCRHGDPDRRGPTSHLSCRGHEGSGRELHHGRLHGQGLRLRDGQPGGLPGPADPRRVRLHEGFSGGAILPGCEGVHPLRGNLRDPEKGDRRPRHGKTGMNEGLVRHLPGNHSRFPRVPGKPGSRPSRLTCG